MTFGEMMETFSHTQEEIQQHYSEMVKKSANRFEERIKLLENRDLRESTLIVYLGDHGELLGEHGLVSHSTPSIPELVYVPTVFIHPDISKSGIQPETIGQIDIVPTVLSALNKSGSRLRPEGVNLFEEVPSERYNDGMHTYSIRGRDVKIYQSAGLWDGEGGHTFTSHFGRLLTPLIIAKRSRGWNREFLKTNPRQIPQAIRTLATHHTEYSNPGFSKKVARETIQRIQEEGKGSEVEKAKLDEEVEDRLEDLGYR
ncbi:sulfatase-like hydrolase/transferase [Haloarcula sp. JP-Z28]|uniref:sulfatase-like hydrolase/transferase n=1 Tax=Haloarcula sp. JP-Z28 TaxID=2716715 RepID=UPI0014048D86|nr:sulfatase-like hydrolase/transferase [Haloarcula sp. JP-Z28]NHN65061.1 sulfatase-like hydrolase/transferase [Haloarcula sp. JP-Z28]